MIVGGKYIPATLVTLFTCCNEIYLYYDNDINDCFVKDVDDTLCHLIDNLMFEDEEKMSV